MGILNLIVDNITNWHAIAANLPKKFTTAFSWIEAKMKSAPASGRYDLEEECYALVQVNPHKSLSGGRFENHRKYIDVQFIVAGRERIFWTLPQPVKELEHYNDAKDIEFFEAVNPFINASSVLLTTGMYAIFFPSDWHMPGITPEAGMPGNESKIAKMEAVQKIVVKVPVG